MKNACGKWKDELLEAALTGTASKALKDHLQDCRSCAAEFRELEMCRARQDSLLPLFVQGSQPSADFRARVLAASEAAGHSRQVPHWRAWALAGATVAAATVFVIAGVWYREMTRKIPTEELAAAQRLAEWRAPSDTLLATPGQDLLSTTPTLGGSYLRFPVNKIEEE